MRVGGLIGLLLKTIGAKTCLNVFQSTRFQSTRSFDG